MYNQQEHLDVTTKKTTAEPATVKCGQTKVDDQVDVDDLIMKMIIIISSVLTIVLI